MTRRKRRAFAQVCKKCRKIRPIDDFRSTSGSKINKTCRPCLDGRDGRDGAGEEVAGEEGTTLPVVVPLKDRPQRRWWPAWVHAKDPTLRPNPRGSGELRVCERCKVEYTSVQQTQRFCSRRCKSAWHRLASQQKKSLDT